MPQQVKAFQTHYLHKKEVHVVGVSTYFRLTTEFGITTLDDVINDFIKEFNEQISILVSIPAFVEVQEISLKKLISAEFTRTEIEEAENLLTAKYYRAAGALAGVALESYLKTLCSSYKINYLPKPSLDSMIQILYKNGKLDSTEMKYMQYLASIRNKCSHADNVLEADVRKLVESVRALTNSMR